MRKTLLTPPLWLLLSLLILGCCMRAEAAEPTFSGSWISEILNSRMQELREQLEEQRAQLTDRERARLLLKEQVRLAEQRGVQVDVYREQTLDRTVFFAIGAAKYWVTMPDGQTREYRMDAAPYIKPPGRTFVPVRFLGYALGVAENDVTWEPQTQRVGLRLAGNELGLQIGSRVRTRNGRADEMDVAPELVEPGRTMLPARFVAEGLGYQVDWDKDDQIVIVWRSGPRPEVPEVVKAVAERERKLADAPEVVRRAAEAVPEAEVKKQTALTTTTWWLIVGPGCKVSFPPAESDSIAGLRVNRTASWVDVEKARAALAQAVPEEVLSAFWPVLKDLWDRWQADRSLLVRKRERFAGRLVGYGTWAEESGLLTARFAKEGI